MSDTTDRVLFDQVTGEHPGYWAQVATHAREIREKREEQGTWLCTCGEWHEPEETICPRSWRPGTQVVQTAEIAGEWMI